MSSPEDPGQLQTPDSSGVGSHSARFRSDASAGISEALVETSGVAGARGRRASAAPVASSISSGRVMALLRRPDFSNRNRDGAQAPVSPSTTGTSQCTVTTVTVSATTSTPTTPSPIAGKSPQTSPSGGVTVMATGPGVTLP